MFTYLDLKHTIWPRRIPRCTDINLIQGVYFYYKILTLFFVSITDRQNELDISLYTFRLYFSYWYRNCYDYSTVDRMDVTKSGIWCKRWQWQCTARCITRYTKSSVQRSFDFFVNELPFFFPTFFAGLVWTPVCVLVSNTKPRVKIKLLTLPCFFFVISFCFILRE